VNIAAVRPVEQVLRWEAEKHQEEWQILTSVIGGGRTRNTLLMFLQHLFDNNEPGFFYLHEDRSFGIHQSCCAILALSVALRAQHYDMLLAAKLAQLKEPFQAKLGWLMGNMYSRVGTTEWDQEKTEPKRKQYAEQLLAKTFVIVPDEQIKDGIADLKDRKELAGKQPEEILAFIQATKAKPRSTKLQERAMEVITGNKQLRPINQIRGRASTAIRGDDTLKEEVMKLLGEAGTTEPADLAEKLIRLFDDRMSAVLADDQLPGRDELLQGFVRGILTDAKIARILQ
jgi:hypothetical protein